MRLFFSGLLFIVVAVVFSQEKASVENAPKVKIDSLYREDQFYFGVSYNTLRSTPKGFSKNKLSAGFTGGFLRDMPMNKKRTIAIAIGVGFTYNNYIQNIAISGSNEVPVYTVLDDAVDYSKNKFSQFLIDVPIEFRWRTSTYESTKFWRIYSGFKCSYLVSDHSVFNTPTAHIKIANNKDFNTFLYGAYVSAGYNTINVYAYYGLNSIFKSGTVNGESLQMKPLNLGVIFYIL
jgi:Outer membrane protein beta-barrel domain